MPAAVVVAAAIGGILWALDGMFNRFDVTIGVENATGTAVSRVEFYFDGRTIALTNIAPGATARRDVTLRGVGPMNFAVLPQPATHPPGTAVSYLDADCKGYRIGVRLCGDGTSEHFLP